MAEHTLYPLAPCLQVGSLVSAFEAEYGPDFCFAGEKHDFWELVYVRRGLACVTADERHFELQPGQMIFHRPGEFHRLWASGGGGISVVVVAFAAHGPGLRRLPNRVFTAGAGVLPMLRAVLRAVDGCFARPSLYSLAPGLSGGASQSVGREIARQRVANGIEGLLLELAAQDDQPEAGGEGREAAYAEMLEVLYKNVAGTLTVAAVARACGLSETAAKTIFKRYAGCGIIEVYRRLKMERATALLRQGHTAAEVSAMLSFSSPYYFSTAFKRVTGHPPMWYKKQAPARGA